MELRKNDGIEGELNILKNARKSAFQKFGYCRAVSECVAQRNQIST